MGGGRYGLDAAQRAFFALGSDAIEAGSTESMIVATAHGLRVGDMIRFDALTTYEYMELSVIEVVDANSFNIGYKLPTPPVVGETFTTLRPVSQQLSPSGAFTIISVPKVMVDELDAESINPAVTTIPKSSSNAISVVASLAGNATEIQVISDVGEFMAIYSDAARTTKICNLPLTPDEKVNVYILAGTPIYLGAIKDVDITADSLLLINFMG